MKLLIEIPAEDFNEVVFHTLADLSTDLMREILDRIRNGEEIIDADFSAIKAKCRFCPHCEYCDIPDKSGKE